ELLGVATEPSGNQRLLFSARGRINREGWGLTWEGVIGGRGTLGAEGIRGRRSAGVEGDHARDRGRARAGDVTRPIFGRSDSARDIRSEEVCTRRTRTCRTCRMVRKWTQPASGGGTRRIRNGTRSRAGVAAVVAAATRVVVTPAGRVR